MKLGFWNRLAIVTGALTTLIAPTWIVISERIETAEAKQSGYRACMKAFNEAPDRYDPNFCAEQWLETDWHGPGWPEWFQAIAAVAFLCLILYLLIAAAVGIVKWVWRGRSANA